MPLIVGLRVIYTHVDIVYKLWVSYFRKALNDMQALDMQWLELNVDNVHKVSKQRLINS